MGLKTEVPTAWIERATFEKENLETEIEKLDRALATQAYTADTRDLLVVQLAFMKGYADTLGKRLALAYNN